MLSVHAGQARNYRVVVVIRTRFRPIKIGSSLGRGCRLTIALTPVLGSVVRSLNWNSRSVGISRSAFIVSGLPTTTRFLSTGIVPGQCLSPLQAREPADGREEARNLKDTGQIADAGKCVDGCFARIVRLTQIARTSKIGADEAGITENHEVTFPIVQEIPPEVLDRWFGKGAVGVAWRAPTMNPRAPAIIAAFRAVIPPPSRLETRPSWTPPPGAADPEP